MKGSFKILFSVLISFLLFTNCSKVNKKAEQGNIQIIQIHPQNQIIKYSDIFKNYRVIPLKSNGKNFVGSLAGIKIYNNLIIVKASSENSNIHVFDIKGNYITNIGKKGKGPGEYLHIRSMKVNKEENLIEVLAYSRKCIIRYSLKGDLIDELPIKNAGYPDDFERIDNNHYVFYYKLENKTTNNKINIYSTERSKITSSYLPINEKLSEYLVFGELTNLYHRKDEICFYTTFTDTIYNISQTGVFPKYVFNMGNYKLPHKILYGNYSNVGEFVRKCKKSPYIWNINYLLEGDKYLTFSYYRKDIWFWGVYNKIKNECKSSNTIFDDMCFMQKSSIKESNLWPIGINGNKIYFEIVAYQFIAEIENLKKKLSKVEWEHYQANHSDLIEIYKGLNINENTILIEFTFK